MFFNKNQKVESPCVSRSLVGLRSELFALPSYTLSQKMCFRVGRPHFFNWKVEDVPRENTSFETKCWKVVQILTSGDLPKSIFLIAIHIFDVFKKSSKMWIAIRKIDIGRSPEVNIWTTFLHFVSKDVFSRGTSSLFQLKKWRRPTRKHIFWDKVLEGSPNIDFVLSKVEREHSNPDRERGPKPPPPPERERESKREQDKERERKRARKRRRGEGKSIALYIKKPTSRSPAPEAAPMLVVVVVAVVISSSKY